MRPIKLIVASCTFSCRFLRIGVIRGTAKKKISQKVSAGTVSGLTKILDGWVHLRHTHHVCDGTLCGDDATKGVGILFTELLEQDQSEFVKELILATLLNDNGKARSEIGGLLTDFCALVVETPKDRRDDLGEVGLNADT